MIPKNIRREHIIKAIDDVKKFGFLKGRNSRNYFLEYNGMSYPPKYIVSLANKYANGKELDPSEFNGGKETNDFLSAFGFKIVNTPLSEKTVLKSNKKNNKIHYLKIHHNERCPECKETIKKILKRIYGEVEYNHKFDTGTYSENFISTLYYDKLKEIYGELQNHRGFKDFVKVKTLPNCDFFVPNPGFIVEFDESQHFTIPRRIALEHYPEKLELGFDRKRWQTICEKINAKDNDPYYRDEQRAWYDTLRDFLPALIGLKPTVRLFARDFEWCSLNPDNPVDIKRFESFLKSESGRHEIKIRKDPDAFLARIIIADEWMGNPKEAKKLLENVYNKWPKGKKVKFIITCGGFIQFDWPKSIFRSDIGDNKYPNNKTVETLVEDAEKSARYVLSNGLDEKLRELTDFITLGIDSYKEKVSTTQNFISQLHVELVFLIDLKNNKFYWIGKSYPTNNQQSGLVRISDLKTHFLELNDIGKVMILGCHDLNLLIARGKKTEDETWRETIKKEFQKLSKEKKPDYILHHPHTTDTSRIWSAAWGAAEKLLPSVKFYASAGRYYRSEGKQRSELNDVLEKTKSGNTVDFIVQKIK